MGRKKNTQNRGNVDSSDLALPTPTNKMEMKKKLGKIKLQKAPNEQVDYSGWLMQYPSACLDIPSALMSRTEWLVLDYQRFKAARTIQKNFRCWHCQLVYERIRCAAIIIQTHWRRHKAQSSFFQLLEDQLKQRIETFYNRRATMIQALWRGFWSRQTVHDHHALFSSQVAIAEDMLQCVAFKLHHLLRTYHIPGVYSLRNSHCLSKVEKLLAAMSFKQHNDRVRQLREARDHRIDLARRKYADSAFFTDIPYYGPNLLGLCDYPELHQDKDLDRRLFKILTTYQNATSNTKSQQQLQKNRVSHQKKSASRRANSLVNPLNFCSDILNSMKRWSILDERKVIIDRNIFRHPGRLEKFLNDVDAIYKSMQQECYCRGERAIARECEFSNNSEDISSRNKPLTNETASN